MNLDAMDSVIVDINFILKRLRDFGICNNCEDVFI